MDLLKCASLELFFGIQDHIAEMHENESEIYVNLL
jgi:hypothetical protein